LFSGDCLKPFDGVMVTDNSCTLFECMIKSKPRAELVGIIHQNFSFIERKFQVFFADMTQLKRMNAGYASVFKEPRPARVTVSVAALAVPTAHVEIMRTLPSPHEPV
jgi:hypothetical protein